MSWTLKKFDELSTNELYMILQQRTQVFVVEQNCPYLEVDGKDYASYHLFKQERNEIVAYLRVLPQGVSYKEASIGRVLVNKKYRGKGIAYELMNKGLQFLHNNLQQTTVKIQAQHYLQAFYQSFGFETISDIYLEDGIPHIDMLLVK